MTKAQAGGKLSAICTGSLYPRKYYLCSFLLEADSTLGNILRSGGFYVNEISSDTSRKKFVWRHRHVMLINKASGDNVHVKPHANKDAERTILGRLRDVNKYGG